MESGRRVMCIGERCMYKIEKSREIIKDILHCDKRVNREVAVS